MSLPSTLPPEPATGPVLPPGPPQGLSEDDIAASAALGADAEGGRRGPMTATAIVLAVLGTIAIVAGTLALLTQTDPQELVAEDTDDETETVDEDGAGLDDLPFDQLPDGALPDDLPLDQLPGSLPENLPLDQLPDGALPDDLSLDDLPLDQLPEGAVPGAGDLGPEVNGEQAQQLLEELQNRFDNGQEIPLDRLGAPGITAQQQQDGVTTLRGPDGEPLHIVPEGVPAGDVDESQRNRALKPSPNGEFSGVEVDENGQLVPVPRGQETEDTLRFDFGERGVESLIPDNSGGLDIDPDRSGAPTDGVTPGDQIQEELESGGRAEFDIDGQELTIERLPNGILRATTPEGDELYFDPYSLNRGDGAAPQPGLGEDPSGGVFSPSTDGPYAGFRINENGEFELVPRGEETDDMFNFGFNADGQADRLFLPDESEPVEIPQTEPGRSFGGDLGLSPQEAAPGVDLAPPPASGDVLSPDQLRAEAQERFDSGLSTPVEADAPDDGVTVRQLPDGTVELRGPEGDPLFLVPEGVPSSEVPDGFRGRAFKPTPDGDIVGVEIDESGELVPVPRGEETEDTLRFDFGERGVTGIVPTNPDESPIEIAPGRADDSAGESAGQAAGGAQASPPEIARDEAQSDLEEQGSTTLDLDEGQVEVEQLEGGDLRFTAPDGSEILVDPDGAASGLDPGVSEDGVVIPSPGSVGGLDIQPDGSLVPVPPAALDENDLRFEFDENGEVDGLDLPGEDSGSLNVPELEEEEAPEPLGGDIGLEPEEADPTVEQRNGRRGLGLFLIAGGLVLFGIAAGLLLLRGRRSGPDPVEAVPLSEEEAAADAAARAEAARLAAEAEEQQRVVNETVESLSDRLRREPDPRKAVLRAYAVIEGGIGGVSRQSSESHMSYLHRVLGNNPHHEAALTELTSLFELARYSDYPITEDMRASAIRSLENVRGNALLVSSPVSDAE